MLTYLNFDLQIERAEEAYQTSVVESPIQQTATATFKPSFSEKRLIDFLQSFRGRGSELSAIRDFGRSLFQGVFNDRLLEIFNRSLETAQEQEAMLRIRLRLKAPELLDLPWEYLYNPAQENFLFLSRETTLVRYFDLPKRTPLPVKLPLRILAIIANPADYGKLEVERELNNLMEALGALETKGRVAIERLQPVTIENLQERLLLEDYHIFHFIGHGGFDEQTQESVLVFGDEEHKAEMVSGRRLGVLMRDERTLRLAVLNTCDSARVDHTDPFAGTAQSMVLQGAPAVVAMQAIISDMAAINFARGFYSTLANGFPVDAALTEGRKAIIVKGNDLEWGIPVLYTRSPDGRVLDISFRDEPSSVKRAANSNVSADKPLEKILVFISYSHADEKWYNPLFDQLESLQAKKGGVPFELWGDSLLSPGEDWPSRIAEVRGRAHIAIQLISDNYLRSKTIQSDELPHLLKLQVENNLRLIPILVDRCDWQSVDWLARLLILPRGVRPLSELDPKEIFHAIEEISQEIVAVIDDIAASAIKENAESNRLKSPEGKKSLLLYPVLECPNEVPSDEPFELVVRLLTQPPDSKTEAISLETTQPESASLPAGSAAIEIILQTPDFRSERSGDAPKKKVLLIRPNVETKASFFLFPEGKVGKKTILVEFYERDLLIDTRKREVTVVDKMASTTRATEPVSTPKPSTIDQQAEIGEEGGTPPAPSKPSGLLQIWLVAADPEHFDWERALASRTGRREFELKASWSNVEPNFQPGDTVLAYSTLGNHILGIGQILDTRGATKGSGTKLPAGRFSFSVIIRQLLDEGVTIDELRLAVPDLQDFPPADKPVSIWLVMPEQWAPLHALILHHNPSLSISDLPPVTVPELRRIEFEAITSSYGGTSAGTFEAWLDNDYTPLVPGKDINVIVTLRNRGNTTWVPSENLEINCDWWREGVSSYKSQLKWDWIYAISKSIPPGHEEKINYNAHIPDEPGKYRTRWSAKGVNWPAETEPATKIFRVAVGEISARSGGTGDGTNLGNAGRAGDGADTGNGSINPRPPLRIDKPAPPPFPPQMMPALTAPSINLSPVLNAPPASEKTIRVLVSNDIVSMLHNNEWHISPNRIDAAVLEATSLNDDEYGKLLFQGLFHDGVILNGGSKAMLDGYKSAVKQADGELRFELVLTNPALHKYKWEYLRDPNDELRPLATYEKSPFYRRIGNVLKKSVQADPLKILIAICNPIDLGREVGEQGQKFKPELAKLMKLPVAREREIVATALSRLQKVAEYKIMDSEGGEAVTLEALTKELQNGYHILHLISHGLFMGGKYFLVMEDQNRRIKLEDANSFEQAMVGGDLRLVVLAACNSGTAATGEALTGLGPNLVGEKIPAVIAMQAEVRIDTAQRFTQYFYDALARSGCVDMAMAATRFAIYQESDGKESQWGIPVLFMSTDDGELFEVNKQKVEANLPPLHKAEIKTYPDLTPQKLTHALEAEARSYDVGAEVLKALRTIVSPAAKSLPQESAAGLQARPQDRGELTKNLQTELKLDAKKLQDYIQNGSSKLRLSSSVYMQLASALNAGKHLILIGPPGTGKTSLAHDICRCAQDSQFAAGATFATASADWTAFDTVGGYVPTEQQTLQFRCGIFLQAICLGYWLVIDEINRAEIDKAFGELFTVLSGQQVDLPYKIGSQQVRVMPPKSRNLQDWVPNHGVGLSGYDYVIHPNWRIIGTMNVYDKSSLFAMSFAFMRRFAFIDVDLPDPETYEALIKNWAIDKGLPVQENGKEAAWLETFRQMLQRDNDLMRHRALGPAISKDMIAYIGDRFESLPKPVPQPVPMMEFFAEAFLLYATPQLDGLEQNAIRLIYKHVNKLFGHFAEDLGLLPRIRALYPHLRRQEWDEWLKNQDGEHDG